MSSLFNPTKSLTSDALISFDREDNCDTKMLGTTQPGRPKGHEFLFQTHLCLSTSSVSTTESPREKSLSVSESQFAHLWMGIP